MIQDNGESLQLSTLNWVRIWSSPTPSEDLPELDKHRTRKFLKINPGKKMTVIYSSALLEASGKRDLIELEQQINNKILSFYDFCSAEFKAELTNDSQRILFTLTIEELLHLHTSKNDHSWLPDISNYKGTLLIADSSDSSDDESLEISTLYGINTYEKTFCS